MHLFDASLGFLGGHGIVGGHIPLTTGMAFAAKYRNTEQVAICYFGEAAVNNGAFHEALNMAALWKLPCLFIIENNKYGMGTAVERAAAIKDLSRRADAYEGMAGEHVDGQDVFAVRDAMSRALEVLRRESKPVLLEIRTYRYMGHSMSDAVSGTYRTKAELDEYLKRDPINLLKSRLSDAGELEESDVAAMEQEIKETVQDAWDFADASPEPAPEALYEDVLVDTVS
jgi:pyruvate dehydrogenase E1 component alpha subunit